MAEAYIIWDLLVLQERVRRIERQLERSTRKKIIKRCSKSIWVTTWWIYCTIQSFL